LIQQLLARGSVLQCLGNCRGFDGGSGRHGRCAGCRGCGVCGFRCHTRCRGCRSKRACRHGRQFFDLTQQLLARASVLQCLGNCRGFGGGAGRHGCGACRCACRGCGVGRGSKCAGRHGRQLFNLIQQLLARTATAGSSGCRGCGGCGGCIGCRVCKRCGSRRGHSR